MAQNLSGASDAKLAPLSLIFAIPDHPWLKSALSDGQAATDHAAVRIAMTVGERGEHIGHLYRVKSEGDTSAEGTDVELTEETGDRKSTRLNSSHYSRSRMPSSA